MTPEQTNLLIDWLQFFAIRPALFIGNHDPERAELWLSGFATAIDVQDGLTEKRRQLRENVLKDRGWEVRSTSSWRQMVEQKMTPADIINEMVAVEIEVLKRISATQS